MQLDKDTVLKVAHLSRLHISENQIDATIEDMNKILTFMEKLNELDTNGVEPLVYMTSEVNVFRPDVVAETLTTEAALMNAPAKEGDFFKVIKVLNK